PGTVVGVPVMPGTGAPAVEAVAAQVTERGQLRLRMTALAVPGHPDGEVDTRASGLIRPRHPRRQR
ncbi:MAG: hypothetical protein ACYCO3_15155, partial [Mycobacteriales bacterium]